MRLPFPPLAFAFIVLLASSSALARNGGMYVELAPSWGFIDAKDLPVEYGDDSIAKTPIGGFLPTLKLGVNLFGWAGVEAHAAAHWWDPNGDPGGGGYVGGVGRITPLEILTYVLPAEVQLPSLVPAGPVSWKNRPFDLGVSFGGGATIVGEDYAYFGSYFQWGFDAKFFFTPNFAVGLDLPFRHMFYEPFRYANYSQKKGFCAEGGQGYGYNSAGNRVDVEPGPRGSQPVPEIQVRNVKSECADGEGPTAFLFAPAITIAGVFDFGI